MRAATIAVLVGCAALAATGCGDGEEASDGRPAAPESRTIDRGPGPPVEIPGGPPPRRLVVEDLRRGKGPAAKGGDELEVEYVGSGAYASASGWGATTC
jgi:hypothetical protein